MALSALLPPLLPTAAGAFSWREYCVATANAERQRCHAEHQVALADCAEEFATARYLDLPTAREDVVTCRTDASDTCAECRLEAVCQE